MIKGEVEVKISNVIELEKDSASPEGLLTFIILYFYEINWKVSEKYQKVLKLIDLEL